MKASHSIDTAWAGVQLQGHEEAIYAQKRKVNYCEVNYREVNNVLIPRAKRMRSTTSNELYPVERQGAKRVKVHYIGYSSTYDESGRMNQSWNQSGSMRWKVPRTQRVGNAHLNFSRLTSIWCSKSSSHSPVVGKTSPTVKIVAPFDAVHFNGGLKLVGTSSRKVQGTIQ